MAKTTKAESPRQNRVRFMMLDADLSDDNLSALTQAITSAIGRNAQNGKIQSLPPVSGINGNSNGTNSHLDVTPGAEDEEQHDDVVAETEETPRTPKKAAQPKMPKYVKDLFTKDQGEEFKAAYGAVSSHATRYLVCAAWLKEKHGKATINIDDVYTCYRAAGWSTDFKDWDSHFRGATKADKMHRANPGEYEITPLGESAVPAPALATA